MNTHPGGRNGSSFAYSFSLLSIMLFTVLGTTLLRPVIDLNLNRAGQTKTYIGANGVMWELGCFLAALLLVRILRRWGQRVLLAVCLALLPILILATPPLMPTALLFPARFLLGLLTTLVCLACITGAVVASGKENHGTTLCVITASATGAKALGSAMVRPVGIDGYGPFLFAAMSVGLGLLLLVGQRNGGPKAGRCSPRPPLPRGMGPSVARGALIALAFCAGACRAAFFTFLPIFAAGLGFRPEDGALLLAVAFAGAVILSVPIGRLGDRFGHGRMLVLVMLAVVAASIPLVTPFAGLPGLMAMVFVIGGGVSTTRDLGQAVWSCRHPEPENVIAHLSFWAGLGAVVGVLGTGVLMDLSGPLAFGYAVIGGSVLIMVMAASTDPRELKIDEDAERESDPLLGADKILIDD